MLKLFSTIFVLLFPVLPLQALEIKDNLSAEKILKPDIYQIYLLVKTVGKTEEEVLNTLSALDNGIKMLSINYNGGYYQILPIKVWDEKLKRYRQEGFEGSVLYVFKLRKPDKQKRIFQLLENIKKNYPISYSVVEENWAVSNEVLKQIKEKLKAELLREAKLKAKEYGKILKKRCDLKKLHFEEYGTPISPYPTLKVITPKKENKVVKIEASVVYECH